MIILKPKSRFNVSRKKANRKATLNGNRKKVNRKSVERKLIEKLRKSRLIKNVNRKKASIERPLITTTSVNHKTARVFNWTDRTD